MTVEDEHVLPRILHDLVAEIIDKPADRHGLSIAILRRHGEGVLALVGEEHLEPPTRDWHQQPPRPLILVTTYVNSTIIGIVPTDNMMVLPQPRCKAVGMAVVLGIWYIVAGWRFQASSFVKRNREIRASALLSKQYPPPMRCKSRILGGFSSSIDYFHILKGFIDFYKY